MLWLPLQLLKSLVVIMVLISGELGGRHRHRSDERDAVVGACGGRLEISSNRPSEGSVSRAVVAIEVVDLRALIGDLDRSKVLVVSSIAVLQRMLEASSSSLGLIDEAVSIRDRAVESVCGLLGRPDCEKGVLTVEKCVDIVLHR